MRMKNVTLEDLLHAINILGEDMDITVDGIDSIAVCPPVKITPEGREHFTKALNAMVMVEYSKSDSHMDTYVSDVDEAIENEAWHMLSALAGYCAESDFQVWFEGETAEYV